MANAKRTTRKNIYGNWVGYVGRARVEEFGEDRTRAQEWVETGEDCGSTRNHEGAAGFKFRFGA